MSAKSNLIAKGQYTIEDWKEESYLDLPAPRKATRAEIQLAFTGDLIGSSNLVYLLTYNNDEHSHFTGVSYFTGTLNGKNGSFVLIEQGEYKNKIVNSHWKIVEDSGTSELIGIAGIGGYTAGSNQVVDWSLEYVL